MYSYFLLSTLAVLLYMNGFFPVPPRTNPEAVTQIQQPTIIGKFRRGVLVIIDALRLDFVNHEQMPFMTGAMQDHGCFVKVSVETPTVTLPRIKALTTGTVSQFIDIIINLASPELLHDSIIHQAHKSGKRVVFYGDDIWLKLFPHKFIRSEGTSSFFVNDFYEVDDNVTKNLDLELHRTDWDVLILHYLGLDHIGHVYGPKSELMGPKLREMDNIIKNIYDYNIAQNEPFFMFVTADHGMRDSGGHGGSTYPETNVPLAILGMTCKNDSFNQIDVAVNFNTLLGIDIPSTSIGMLRRRILQNLTLDEYLEVLRNNIDLLEDKKAGEYIDDNDFKEGIFYHYSYLSNPDKEIGEKAVSFYEKYAEKVRDRLLKLAVNQNVFSLLLGSIVIVIILVKIATNSSGKITKSDYTEQGFMFGVLLIQYLNLADLISSLLVIISFFLLVKVVLELKIGRFKLPASNNRVFIFLYILHPLTFLSSSFLEEEHQYWYFFTGTLCLWLIFALPQKPDGFLLFVILRLVRGLNQVGDQWASEPDLADWFLTRENYVFLHILSILSLVLIFTILSHINTSATITFLDAGLLISMYLFRFVAHDNILLGKLVFIALFCRFIYVNVYSREYILSSWLLLITFLLKPHNLILVPSCYAFSAIIKRNSSRNLQVLTFSHIWLSMVFFFLHGHDNSLASIDIASGYIGLSVYNPALVLPQILCHTFALPVLSHLLLLQDKRIDRQKFFVTCLCLRLYVILVVFIVTFIHRHHLFIWSVFAPKIFIEGGLFAGLVIEASCCYLIHSFVI